MRQNRRWLKPVYLKKHLIIKDVEGTLYTDYENEALEFKSNIQPAGGKIMAEIYGERLGYMLTMYYTGALELKEKDGVCVYVGADESPDYKIVAIKPWNVHKVIHLEKVM